MLVISFMVEITLIVVFGLLSYSRTRGIDHPSSILVP